jgi:DNA-binding MarR family transcriptional regulator
VHDDRREQFHRILDEIAAGGALSQRVLARRVGLALGLINKLLRALAERGLVAALSGPGNRLTYVLTESGSEELARMGREHIDRALALYSAARRRIRQRLRDMAIAPVGVVPRVVCYGTGEVAVIAATYAADAGVKLVGFVGDASQSDACVLGVPVRSCDELTGTSLSGEPFDWVFVIALSEVEHIRRHLQQIGLPGDRVCWL